MLNTFNHAGASSGPLNLLSAQKRPVLLVLLLGIFINIAGIAVRFFTDDPGLYALIARNMVETHNYSNLMFQGHDWLDKPHFPFWAVALSFNLFGISTVAYKIPGLLFYFMSVIYTWLLTKKLYNTDTAIMAVLILLTAQHTIMSNTDVRAEPYIMGLLMGSVYHYYCLTQRLSGWHLLLGSVFAACAVMTKGIYVLIPIGSGIIGQYLFTKNYKALFHWRWFAAIGLTALFIFPEIYALYQQFDLHPEKVVFNHTHVSGIHWFLWDSQFGRFNSTGYIVRTDGSVWFFIHTLLWAFAPWAFMFYFALFISFKQIFKKQALPEYISFTGSVVMLFIFSISKFQLPFYTNILFPFFAIITAAYLAKVLNTTAGKFFNIVQTVIAVALLVVCMALNIVFSPGHMAVFTAITAALAWVTWYINRHSQQKGTRLFLFTCALMVWVNAYFIAVVYPIMLQYKADVLMADYANAQLPNQTLLVTCEIPNGLPFYSKKHIMVAPLSDIVKTPAEQRYLTVVDDDVLAIMQKLHISYRMVKQFENYPQENLTLPFILQSRRKESLNHYSIIRIIAVPQAASK